MSFLCGQRINIWWSHHSESNPIKHNDKRWRMKHIVNTIRRKKYISFKCLGTFFFFKEIKCIELIKSDPRTFLSCYGFKKRCLCVEDLLFFRPFKHIQTSSAVIGWESSKRLNIIFAFWSWFRKKIFPNPKVIVAVSLPYTCSSIFSQLPPCYHI